jgi:hypothetical protein
MRYVKSLILAAFFVLLASFQQAPVGSFSANIDGKAFQLSADQLFRGIVSNKQGTMDGREPARTVISTTFNGRPSDQAEGRLVNEAIILEINYEPDKLGEPAMFSMALQYESGNYFMVKDQSKLTITQFEWESDKKHFLLSADYNCKLRSWGAPADGKKDLTVKGRMTNIRITVPSWVTAKN